MNRSALLKSLEDQEGQLAIREAEHEDVTGTIATLENQLRSAREKRGYVAHKIAVLKASIASTKDRLREALG